MENKTERQYWNEMVNFGEYMICDSKIGLRQDQDEDASTHRLLLSFPNAAKFDHNELKDHKFQEIYDTQTYLSHLLYVAEALNNEFHATMERTLTSLSNANKSLSDNYTYQVGPIKTMESCQFKCQHDYSTKRFPKSKHICDIVRSTVTFRRKCESLIYYLKSFIEHINKENNHHNDNNNSGYRRKHYSFKKIMAELKLIFDT